MKVTFARMREAALLTAIALYRHSAVRSVVSGLAGARHPEKWVFILGCYNSGTTILRTLLSGHPSIRVLPKEGVRFTPELPRPETLGWTRMWIGCPEHMVMPPTDGHRIAERVVRDWSPWWGRGGSVFVEKSISSLTRMHWLQEHFPNSYFIGIHRNGYAVAEGIRRRARPRGLVRDRIGETYPVEWAARQWVDANVRLLTGQADLARYHQLSYESLVRRPVKELEAIFEFLGLASPEPLALSGDLLEIGRLRLRMIDGNEASLRRLSGEDVAAITEVIGDVQRRLGYPVLC